MGKEESGTGGTSPPPSPPPDVHARAKEIFQVLEGILNSPSPYIMAPVYAWLEWGADFEADIRPAAERFLKRGKGPPGSLQWLDEDITRSLKHRRRDMPDVKPSGGQQTVAREERVELTAEELAARQEAKRKFGIGA